MIRTLYRAYAQAGHREHYRADDAGAEALGCTCEPLLPGADDRRGNEARGTRDDALAKGLEPRGHACPKVLWPPGGEQIVHAELGSVRTARGGCIATIGSHSRSWAEHPAGVHRPEWAAPSCCCNSQLLST